MSIEIKNLTFQYPGTKKPVLQNFTQSFPEKGITILTGSNGCGKTTLVRCIMGILKPSAGAVIVDGEDFLQKNLAERGRTIGYVMQNPAKQIFSATVGEEMAFGLKCLGLGDAEMQSRTEKYLKRFHLSGREKEFPFSLSHGEKQRLVLAAILAMQPKYLILDEPTASLDVKNKAKLLDYLRTIEAGIVIISHDRHFNERAANRIIEMEPAL